METRPKKVAQNRIEMRNNSFTAARILGIANCGTLSRLYRESGRLLSEGTGGKKVFMNHE